MENGCYMKVEKIEATTSRLALTALNIFQLSPRWFNVSFIYYIVNDENSKMCTYLGLYEYWVYVMKTMIQSRTEIIDQLINYVDGFG